MYFKTTEEGSSSFSTGGKSTALPVCGLWGAGGAPEPAAFGIPGKNLRMARVTNLPGFGFGDFLA